MSTEQTGKTVIVYDEGDASDELGNCLYGILSLCTVFYTSLLTLAQGKVLVRPIDH